MDSGGRNERREISRSVVELYFSDRVDRSIELCITASLIDLLNMNWVK